MAKNDEKIQSLLEQAEQGIKEVFESDNYRNYLATMSKFHSYSFRNSLLIAMQKPEATFVAGYAAWQKTFKRQVQRGEKGIVIIGYTPKKVTVDQERKDDNGNTVIGADGKPVMDTVTKQIPSFTPVYVYDVSQTEGEPLPVLVNELDGSVETYQDLMTAITAVSPFPIVFEDIKGGAKGYCDPIAQKIAINNGMSDAQNIKTAIHEVTHADLHAPEINLTLNERTDRRTREVEAESTAFVVCSHYGIDTSDYTFPYLATWSSDKELKELQSSLDTIQKQAGDLIDRIDTRLAELQKEHEQQQFQTITPDQAKEIIRAFDEKADRPYSRYLAQENGKWIAIDDSTHNCNVEEFTQRKDAIAWLKGEFEISDFQELPDRNITVQDMEQYGFAGGNMLPVELQKATELFEKSLPVYMLYSDSTSRAADSLQDIQDHADRGGILGVPAADWQQQQRFDTAARSLAAQYEQMVSRYSPVNAIPAYPFSINDPEQRLNTITDRIMQYDVSSLDTVIDQVISNADDTVRDQAIRELAAIKEDYHTFTQDKLTQEVEKFNGEPVVFVRWSESDQLETGQVMPLHEANAFFRSLDMNFDRAGYYDKTAFTVKYKQDGEFHVYEGRQDFGDRDGGLIDHIKAFWDSELTEDQQRQHINSGNTDIIENAKEAVTRFVPYLQMHDAIGQLDTHATKQLSDLLFLKEQGAEVTNGDQRIAYYTALKEYVGNCRTALNDTGELPQLPDRAQYGLNDVESVIDLSDEDKAAYKELAAYKGQVRKEVAAEAKAAGITIDQYLDAGSVPPDGRTFSIYQLKENDSTRYLRFEGLETLRKENGMSFTPKLDNYEKVYSGTLPQDKDLNDIYTEFNINHPADFKGHSLSVSDIVVIEWQGQITANYVDNYGFENIPELAAEVQAQPTAEQKPYYHFYYDNDYLFTVTGENEAKHVLDDLCTSTTARTGYSWTDSGKVYASDQKAAPTSDLWDADKTKTAFIPYSQKGADGNLQYIEAEYRRAADERLDSVKFDNDIDLDREKTRDQLGFRDADREQERTQDQAPQKRVSMKDRFAAAQAEAERRAAGRSNTVRQKQIDENERGDF